MEQGRTLLANLRPQTKTNAQGAVLVVLLHKMVEDARETTDAPEMSLTDTRQTHICAKLTCFSGVRQQQISFLLSSVPRISKWKREATLAAQHEEKREATLAVQDAEQGRGACVAWLRQRLLLVVLVLPLPLVSVALEYARPLLLGHVAAARKSRSTRTSPVSSLGGSRVTEQGTSWEVAWRQRGMTMTRV